MENKSIKSNNKGFSLVELIVVVLIMAIIAGAGIMAFSVIDRNRPDATAKKVADAMKQARVNALALENNLTAISGGYKTDVYAKIYKKASTHDIYVDVIHSERNFDGALTGDEKVLSSTKVCSDDLKIEVRDATNSLGSVGSDTIYIYFKKSTGGVAGVMVNSTPKSGAKVIRVTGAESDYYQEDLILVELTGRCYQE